MVVRLFYIAVLLALMTILPFLPAAGISAEETPTLAESAETERDEGGAGKIVKIDPVTQRIRVVPGIFSRAQEVRVTARTEIMIHGRPATFSALQPGDKVRVRSLADHEDQTAESIDVV